jgi:hypothetical protein
LAGLLENIGSAFFMSFKRLSPDFPRKNPTERAMFSFE